MLITLNFAVWLKYGRWFLYNPSRIRSFSVSSVPSPISIIELSPTAHCPNGPVFSLACGRWLPRRDDGEISIFAFETGPKPAARSIPGRNLVNVNLRSDVPARGNRTRVCGCDIYMYMYLLSMSLHRFNARTLLHREYDSRAIWETRPLWDIACSFTSPSSIFKFSLTQIPESVCHKRATDASPARYTWSHNFFIRIGELFELYEVICRYMNRCE